TRALETIRSSSSSSSGSPPTGEDDDEETPAEAESQQPPTSVTLSGFKFLNCLGQNPMGDLWKAEDANGGLRRALCLLPFVRYDARLIGHLQALRDPALPHTEVHWSPAERLVVLVEMFEGTIREKFDRCVREGQRGIPRDELLALLRTAASALDALAM